MRAVQGLLCIQESAQFQEKIYNLSNKLPYKLHLVIAYTRGSMNISRDLTIQSEFYFIFIDFTVQRHILY